MMQLITHNNTILKNSEILKYGKLHKIFRPVFRGDPLRRLVELGEGGR